MTETEQQVVDRFTYRPCGDDQQSRCETIRTHVIGLSRMIVYYAPGTPEREKALDALDVCLMWTVAAIARGEWP